MLAVRLLLLAMIAVIGCGAAPQDFANQTNITVWPCNNSTGQKW